ncbi:MAG: ABC transporter permease [Burkholderiales bacterium]
MSKLWASACKEMRILLRDREGLAILFVMPVAFVIIMSLALQDFFRQGAAPQFSLVVLDGDQGKLAQAIGHGVQALPFFRVERRTWQDFPAAERQLREDVRAGKIRFALLLPPGLSARHDATLSQAKINEIMDTPAQQGIVLDFLADPALRSDHLILARAALASTVSQIEMQRIYAFFSSTPFDPEAFKSVRGKAGWLSVAGQDGGAAPPLLPSAAQQNVPAYSLLAIFLLVVPLSGTFIKEREQGSLARLESMPVPAGVVIGGKVLPYLMVNLLQVALCFTVGRYVLPLLGGEALRFGHSWGGVIALSLAASLAAIGFGLLVALCARTVEQATAFGATAVLLLAALGGIMVPKMLMPAVLQSIAAWSPLGWALDGYLDVFVRDAGLGMVLPRILALLAFAGLCFATAMWRYSTRAHLR